MRFVGVGNPFEKKVQSDLGLFVFLGDQDYGTGCQQHNAYDRRPLDRVVLISIDLNGACVDDVFACDKIESSDHHHDDSNDDKSGASVFHD